MTDYTDNMDIPYPMSSDIPAGHLQLQSIASQLDAVLGGPWHAYTPTITGFNAGSTTVVARYRDVGHTIFYSGLVYVNVDNSQNGLITVSLPKTPKSDRALGAAVLFTGQGVYSAAAIQSAGSLRFKIYNDSSVGDVGYSFTLSTGNYLAWNIRYEST